jgi:hypothetical protein
MNTDTRTTVKEKLAGFFTLTAYDGSYHDATGFRTAASDEASASFGELTGGSINWAQVHGNFKDATKRALFVPYPHWTELYDACQRVVRAHAEVGTEWWGPLTAAKLMGDTMTVMREKYGRSVPRWWLPIMNKLRGK